MQKKFETLLIEQCAPTLAGIKTANLFCYQIGKEDLLFTIRHWNALLCPFGIRAMILKYSRLKNNCLIYVYREKRLRYDLHQSGVMNFLCNTGYQHDMAISELLAVLSLRLTCCDSFPHEIGIFLGYPLHDVVGFITHKGNDFYVSGMWKVYKHPEKALKSFRQYKKCTSVYKQLYQNGRSILQLSVAA